MASNLNIYDDDVTTDCYLHSLDYDCVNTQVQMVYLRMKAAWSYPRAIFKQQRKLFSSQTNQKFLSELKFATDARTLNLQGEALGDYLMKRLIIDIHTKSFASFSLLIHVLRMIDEDSKDFNLRRHSAKLIKMLGNECIDLLPSERQIFLDKTTNKIRPNQMTIFDYNAYLKSSIDNNNFDNYDQMFIEMEKRLIKPTLVTHIYRLNHLSRLGPIDQALKYHEKFLKNIRLPDLQIVSLNLLIRAHFGNNDEASAVKTFETFGRMSLKPTAHTYYELISGYMKLKQYDNAHKLLTTMSSAKTLDISTLVSLYERLAVEYQANGNSLAKRMLDDCMTHLDPHLASGPDIHIHVVNKVACLLVNKLNDDAYNLIAKLYKHEYQTENLELRDKLLNQIDVADYFCKFLIKTGNSIDEILKYQALLDANFTANQCFYLKSLTYNSLANLVASDDKNELTRLPYALFNEFQRKNLRLRASIFAPLIVNKLKVISCLDADAKQLTRKTKHWQDISAILQDVVGVYGIDFKASDVELILFLLNNRNNHEFIDKSYGNVNVLDVIKLFPKNVRIKTIVITLMKKLIEMKNYKMINKCMTLDDVHDDFDLFTTIQRVYPQVIYDLSLSKYLIAYVMHMETNGFINDHLAGIQTLKSDRILAYLIEVNNRIRLNNVETNEALKRVNETYIMAYVTNKFLAESNYSHRDVLDFCEYIKPMQINHACVKKLHQLVAADNPVDQKAAHLNLLLNKIEESFYEINQTHSIATDAHANVVADTTRMVKWNEENMDELEALLNELRTKGKPIYACMRRLLNHVCNQSLVINDLVKKRVAELESELPANEFTLPLYGSLMFFYSKHCNDYSKAKFYYDKLLSKPKGDFRIDPHKPLWFAIVSIEHDVPLDHILATLKSFDFEKPFHYMKNPVHMFFNTYYHKYNAVELGELFDVLFRWNYVEIFVNTINLILLKYVTSGQLDSAIAMYERNHWEIRKIPESFVDLLCAQLVQSNGTLNTPNIVIQLITKRHGQKMAYGMLMLALVKAKEYEKAKHLLEVNLNYEIDIIFIRNYFNALADHNLLFHDIISETKHAFMEFLNYVHKDRIHDLNKILFYMNEAFESSSGNKIEKK